jgi:hypothetical protein
VLEGKHNNVIGAEMREASLYIFYILGLSDYNVLRTKAWKIAKICKLALRFGDHLELVQSSIVRQLTKENEDRLPTFF